MRKLARDAFFMDTPRGRRFCLLTAPVAGLSGGLLFVHPFAEEMNKSRRMVALSAQAFAESGWAVLQIDCGGCGDSDGDFSESTWRAWQDDFADGWCWLQQYRNAREPAVPLGVWALRAGSLLLGDWLQGLANYPPLLLWQPVTNGKQHLTQFLRLRAANEMLSDADARGVMARIRSQLSEGEAVEVAGYTITAELANDMDVSSLRLPEGWNAPVHILEVSSMEVPECSPATRILVDKWRAAGISVEAEAVRGGAFWQTQEIETAPELVEPSLRFLQRVCQ